MKKYIIITLVLIVISTLALVGCDSSTPTTTAAPSTSPTSSATSTTAPAATTAAEISKYGGTLKILDTIAPSTDLGYQPEKDYVAKYNVYNTCIETLVRMSDTGEMIPWLATDVQVDIENLQATITLRKNIKFHDGSDFNAEVCVWNMARVQATRQGSYSTWDSFEAIDDYTVSVKLKYWENSFWGSLSSTSIISKASYDANGEEWSRWNPVGTGPFVFAGFERDVSTKFTRNDNYWQEGLPYLDAVEWHYFADEMTLAAAFMSGEGQMVLGASNKTASDLINEGYERVPAASYGGGVAVLQFDSIHPDSPFSNQKVREAVWYAIDRESIVKATGFGQTYVVNQFATSPEALAYISDYPNHEYNPEKAKELLAEAGYADGFSCKLYPNPGDVAPEVAMVAIQSYLQAVGIDVDIDFVDSAGFTAIRFMDGWSNGMIFAAHAPGPNFASVMKTFCSAVGLTAHSEYFPDDYTAALNAALSSDEIQPELVQEVNRLACEYVLQIPMSATVIGPIATPGFVNDHGFNTQGSNMSWNPEACWLSPEAR